MSDQAFMRAAIAEAQKSNEQIPCGVVIVKDDHILARAHNSHHADNDATAHAEIKGIRLAGKKLGQKNLIGCAAYVTCEPCTMCSGALLYSEIDRIFYGVTMASIDPKDTRIKTTIEELAAKKLKHPKIVGGLLRQECWDKLYA